MQYRQYMAVVCVILMALITSSAEEPQKDGFKPAKPVRPIETTIPYEIKHLHLNDPSVLFHVLIEDNGTVIDYLAIDATHHILLELAEKALLKANFKPAQKDGNAVSSKLAVRVWFFDPEQRAMKRGMIGLKGGTTSLDTIDRRLYQSKRETFRYKESMQGDLDKPLRMLESKLLLIHPEGEPMQKGRVVVEYTVDHAGRVRLPEIVETDGEYLSLSAISSLRETVFAPPTCDGKPTYVRVRQPFNFD
jgi:hypothetical protein